MMYEKQAAEQTSQKITIDDFKQLQIPPEVMKDGILFVWCEKELISEVINHFDKQGFNYVENMVYVMMDPRMQKSKFISFNLASL